MKTIKFNLNWNCKLYCNCFSTIRPFNPEKYQLNETYEVLLNGTSLGQAQIVYMKDFPLAKITDAMSLVDIGYSAKYAVEVFADLYPHIENIGEKLFTYIILERIQKDINHNNQINENRNLQTATLSLSG